MGQTVLYPLRFEPIYQYRLWGGRRLADLFGAPMPNGPIGEAWVLSDRDNYASKVASGPLAGRSIGHLMDQFQEPLMGSLAHRFQRFPLLLKFLDAHEMLSVQVHPGFPPDRPLPEGETAKTEAWVVIDAGKDSRIYAGLKPGATPEILRQSITDGTLAGNLASFMPKPGDGVFIPAGTVHALGGDVVVFEIQQNSDTTFRLYDWGHIDAKTGKPRALQVDQALACIDFADGAAGLVKPKVDAASPERELLFDCEAFRLWRLRSPLLFSVGASHVPRVLVCVGGTGQIEHDGATYVVSKGEVWMLPAVVGVCHFRPGNAVDLLEIACPTG
ncbi:MAG: type I phosphomannose isomerase catalytic subunit [Acidobacteriaceae bacterium]